jgi:TonB family protein
MKHIKFALLTVSFLLAVLVVQPAITRAQDTAVKPGDKGEVADLLAKLKKSDERVVETCLEDCGETKPATQNVSGGQIIDKPAPVYPTTAKAAHATGEVVVQMIINEEGKVIAAKAISGHPLLQAASVTAARRSRFWE